MNETRPADIRLPCARCGSPVLMPMATASVPTGCDRCTSGSARGVAYTVRQGSQRLLLDHAAIVARIKTREIVGTDHVATDDASWLAVSEHPAFRQHLFPGVSRAPAATAPAASRAMPALKAIAALALVAIVGAGAWVLLPLVPWPAAPRPAEAPKPAPPVIKATPPTPPLPPPPGPAPVAEADSSMSLLAARIGAVADPRALMLARAWTARFRGGEPGITEAIPWAERAAVRVPDVETLGMLAMLYAEAHLEPDLRLALLKRARTLNADHVAVLRADVAEAVVEGRKDDAVALVARCLQVDPKDTWCGMIAVDVAADLTPGERMRAYDALAARSQPGVGMLLRKSATSSIAALAPDAYKRVDDALRRLPGDAELTGYKAVLALRAGDLKLAVATARRLGDKAPTQLRLDLAGHDIGAGDARSARDWLAPLAAHEPDDYEQRFWLHLHSAQADYLEAIGSKEAMRGAADSADAVLLTRPHDATAAQIRVLAALAIGDVQAARRAWGNADTHGLPGPDVAQLFLTAAELSLVGSVPREAMPQLESAQKADPASPDVWLWTARIALEASDPNQAIAAMRSAITQVDGSASHRNPLAFALPRPADAAVVVRLLHRTLDGAAGQEKGLAVSLAAAEWLQGHDAKALEHVSRLVTDRTDPEAMILTARIRLALGDAAVALPLAESAAAARPKEGQFALLRAQCLHALGRVGDAQKALEYVKGGAGLGAAYHVLLGEMAGTDISARARHGQDALAIDPYDQRAVALLGRQ